MRATIFRQYDSRWGGLAFPAGATVKGCGCGLCSVAHILIESDKYKNYTPATIRPFMLKYATTKGLYHNGIPDTLKHYGMENVKEFGVNATMKDIFNECGKGKRKGVILFYKERRGSTVPSIGPDGTYWTGGGHFVAFLDYKVEGGKHWFYTKDSSGHRNDGWRCYEASMAGCVWKVWTCTVPEVKKEKYTGEVPNTTVTIDNGSKVVKKAAELAHPKGTKKAKYAYKTGSATKAFKEAFKNVWKDSEKTKWNAARKKGASCDVFAATVIRALGIDLKIPWYTTDILNYKPGKSSGLERLSYKNIRPISKAEPGDVIIYPYHTLIMGNGVIYEAANGKTYGHRGSIKKLSIKRSRVTILRPKDTSRSYLRKGDQGSEVKKWQMFLVWAGYDIGAIDGDFGDKTKAATVKFQKANKLEGTGRVGSKTVAAMRKAVR